MSEINLSTGPLAAAGQLLPPPIVPERGLNAAQWGMVASLVSEAALFCTLIVVYLTFLGASPSGPTPAVLSLPLVIGTTVCLLSSSVTVYLAEKSLERGFRSAFTGWWSATILLGIVFLAGTACEWNTLIVQHGLTISRNLFGTTYYTLVGFHALHVTMGLTFLVVGALFMVTGLTMWVAALLPGRVISTNPGRNRHGVQSP